MTKRREGSGGFVDRVYETADTLLAGTCAVDTVARALAVSQSCLEVMLQSDPGNDGNVLVGNRTQQVFQLGAGDTVVIPIDDIAKVWIVADGGTQRVNWLAMA